MPGKGKFVKLWPLYLTGFSFYTLSMASLEAQLLRRGGIFTAIAILSALAIAAAYMRHRRASEIRDLRFEEEDDEALTVVSLLGLAP